MLIERLNELNILITRMVESSDYSAKELLVYLWEREEIMDNINKEENGTD